ncbi:MAG TPA: hypothetical protein VFX76_13310 [Roseiflexaceae bacterium]|nr:hypothetical protein [Roseiflexaceae bacterium]
MASSKSTRLPAILHLMRLSVQPRRVRAPSATWQITRLHAAFRPLHGLGAALRELGDARVGSATQFSRDDRRTK